MLLDKHAAKLCVRERYGYLVIRGSIATCDLVARLRPGASLHSSASTSGTTTTAATSMTTAKAKETETTTTNTTTPTKAVLTARPVRTSATAAAAALARRHADDATASTSTRKAAASVTSTSSASTTARSNANATGKRKRSRSDEPMPMLKSKRAAAASAREAVRKQAALEAQASDDDDNDDDDDIAVEKDAKEKVVELPARGAQEVEVADAKETASRKKRTRRSASSALPAPPKKAASIAAFRREKRKRQFGDVDDGDDNADDDDDWIPETPAVGKSALIVRPIDLEPAAQPDIVSNQLLQEPVLSRILNALDSDADYCAFRRVCRAWRRAALADWRAFDRLVSSSQLINWKRYMPEEDNVDYFDLSDIECWSDEEREERDSKVGCLVKWKAARLFALTPSMVKSSAVQHVMRDASIVKETSAFSWKPRGASKRYDFRVDRQAGEHQRSLESCCASQQWRAWQQ